MQAKPVYPFGGTDQQREEFLAEFRLLWEIPPDVDLRFAMGKKFARRNAPLRINGRRIYWQPDSDDYPWGVIRPMGSGWNPQMAQPTELRTWLAIPDDELKAVNRANMEAVKPPLHKSVIKVVVVLALVVAALIVANAISDDAASGATGFLVVSMAMLVVTAFGYRLRRDTPFAIHNERQMSDKRRQVADTVGRAADNDGGSAVNDGGSAVTRAVY